MADRVILTIGTKKGVFVAEAAKPRRSFALRGPFGPGVPVYSTLIDTRGTPRLYASSCNPFFGMKVLRSTNLGKSFKETKSAPAFPKDDGRALANIWSLEAGGGKKELWCGVEPASLFRSRRRRRFVGDGARHQQPRARAQMAARRRRAVHAHDHSRRQSRAPRHLDRRPLLERGRWRNVQGVQSRRRRRLRARSLSRVRPVRAQDRAARRRARPALHAEPRRMGGLDRAWGTAAGHRRAAQRRLRPLVAIDRQGLAVGLRISRSSSTRTTPTRFTSCRSSRRRATCPGGAPAVWRSENGGDSWSRLARGLPKKQSYFTVLRDAMDIDELKTPALYFGTTTGQLWIGREGGEQWDCLFDSLPPIHNVKVAIV